MIPVRLALRNFLSYTDIHEPLLFEGIHVACLSGENGAGKSALLDAITWSLWGQSRARTTDQLVHTGRTEMEVELEFVLAEARYRVVRKRVTKGKGTTILDLASCDESGQFRSISGNSVSETERLIEGLLRMSYTTFTNSSFFLQGKADSFTTRTPADRKGVLADILELAEYDRFQEKARREVQSREQRHRHLESIVRDADAELERRPAYRADQERLEGQLAELDARIEREGAELQRLRERLAALDARERELTRATEQSEQTAITVGRHLEEIAEAERALGELQGLLGREREIEEGYAALVRAREADEALSAKLAEFAALCDERNRLDKHVATERTRLQAELAGLEQRLARLDAEAASLPQHEQEEAHARAAIDALRGHQERRGDVDRLLSGAREQVAELRGSNQRLRDQMTELRGKIEVLTGSATCPICLSALDQAGRESLIERYDAEGKAQRAEYAQNLARIKELDGEVAEQTAEAERLAAQLGGMLGVERRLAAAEQAVQQARQATEEAEPVRAARARLQKTLQDGDFARAETAALAGIQERLDVLDYDQAVHGVQRVTVNAKRRFEGEKRELDDARRAITHQQQLLEQARRSLVSWQERLELERRRVEELKKETRELPALREQADQAAGALDEVSRAQGVANRELGEARQRLAYLDHLEQQRGERLKEMDALLRDKALFSELVAAFGKNGVQAMLIETAIPEIEDEANRLLAAMTEGRMHVTLETQRAARVGDNTIETLDIVINDELGARPYEMYSGGEAFRVDFAIRIALSRLLARRAGARVQTLVIDEGFGSQDETGRERLVEAIQSITDQFAMILVITHLEDLKERFPVRIDVRKTALGSTYTVEWGG
ncbi:MAG: SMC family ATPase [Chloroflexi bacterium]|nr:SMC family ATPase [Chloroflexota bacterium]